MNKSVVGVIVALLVIAAGVGFAVTRQNAVQPTKTTDQTASTQQSSNNNDNQPAVNQPVAQTSNDATDEQTVTIQNQAYTPSKITVKVGTKVTWTNQDGVQHDVMPDQDYGGAFAASDMLSKGESYSFTFTKAGTYTYHCTPHPFMKATVEVVE